MATQNEKKAFKDWFDRAAVKALGEQIASVDRGFELDPFVRAASKGLGALEMMDRVRQISNTLRRFLPDDTEQALDTVTRSLPPPLPDCEAVTDGWLQWPVGQLIADHGITHFEPSMRAMHALTQRFSSEFAVRPFIERYPKETFAKLEYWTADASPHVRRWCSEGCRPRLPWGARLQQLVDDPSPIFPILERLKDDDELYVRRSVANNLNDISKDHPERVASICGEWWRNGSEKRRRLVKHALRSQVKAGAPRALEVLGYGPPRALGAELELTPKEPRIGGHTELLLRLRSSEAQLLLVDYAVHYLLANGKSGRKVFKWKEVALEGTAELKKKHSLRATTIRTLRPGRHAVEVQVNGQVVATSYFDLHR